MIRIVAVVLLVTGCGRIAFDPFGVNGDGGNGDGDNGDGDAVNTCGIRQIDISARHTCAVRNDGAVFCAGDNADAQLGTGAVSAAMATPVAATAFADLGGATVVSVHTGNPFTCVLDTNGALHCLGDNGNRQLGSTTGMVTNPMHLLVPAPPFRTVSLGNTHGCGITTNDETWCWGDGDEGEAGNGTQPNAHDPERVPLASGMGALGVSAGFEHVCVNNDSLGLVCWGSGTLNRLGFTAADSCPNASGGPIACQLLPTSPGVSDAVEVAAGNEHTCIRTISGDVACWGSNDGGQAGAPVSTQVTRTTVGNVSEAVAVATGRHHSCAIMSNGVVGCWGNSNSWELGTANIPDQSAAIVVPLPRPAIALATNPLASFTCALLDDGTASCWGANDSGQLGRGTVSTRELPGLFTIPCD